MTINLVLSDEFKINLVRTEFDAAWTKIKQI